MLRDNHGRVVNYLRLAVTDKCNLRCFYCMPAEGLNWISRKEIMSYEEMLRLCSVMVDMGITKIRITGGEPFVRKDLMQFLHELSQLQKLEHISITTNGVLTAPYIADFKRLGITSVNLSLDTLDRERFSAITRRDELPAVMQTLETLLSHSIETKLNAVVMEGKNTQDILPLVQLTKDTPVSVRFIEEMPFNGDVTHHPGLLWNHVRILDTIKAAFPDIQKIADPLFSTSFNYHIPGHKGTVGIIAAYTRSFCGTCNRIRITPSGELKTCLYDNGVLNIKDLMRSGFTDEELVSALSGAFGRRPKNGFEAERLRKDTDPVHESMATIGG